MDLKNTCTLLNCNVEHSSGINCLECDPGWNTYGTDKCQEILHCNNEGQDNDKCEVCDDDYEINQNKH